MTPLTQTQIIQLINQTFPCYHATELGNDEIMVLKQVGNPDMFTIKVATFNEKGWEWMGQGFKCVLESRRNYTDHLCNLCGQPWDCKYGHNPEPLARCDLDRCCDKCNYTSVMKHRMIEWQAYMEDPDGYPDDDIMESDEYLIYI